MRKLLLLPFLLLSLVSSFAQTPVTITGTITDSSNNVAVGGYIQFVLTPTNQSLPYSVLPSTVVAMVSKCGINTSGQPVDIVTGLAPCVVWPNDLISPGNSLYQITIAPNNRVTRIYNNVLIKSTVNPQPLATLQFISPQPVIGTIINGSPLVTMSVIPSVDSVWTVGDPQHYYAAGYFKNLTVSGSLSCVGCATTVLKTNGVANSVQSTLDLTEGTGIHFASGALGVVTAALTNTAVTPGTYNLATVTVDQQGRITGASNGSITSNPILNELQNCAPDQTGNSTYSQVALTAWVAGHWEFVKNQNSNITCVVRIPASVPVNPKIILEIAANDSTAGHTANFQTCDAVVTTGSINPASLTCAVNQTFTTTATAYQRVTFTFDVQSSLSANSMLIVKVATSTTGTAPSNNILAWAYFKAD